MSASRKDELWDELCAKQPHFREPEFVITRRTLRSLFDSAYEQGFKDATPQDLRSGLPDEISRELNEIRERISEYNDAQLDELQNRLGKR